MTFSFKLQKPDKESMIQVKSYLLTVKKILDLVADGGSLVVGLLPRGLGTNDAHRHGVQG